MIRSTTKHLLETEILGSRIPVGKQLSKYWLGQLTSILTTASANRHNKRQTRPRVYQTIFQRRYHCALSQRSLARSIACTRTLSDRATAIFSELHTRKRPDTGLPVHQDEKHTWRSHPRQRKLHPCIEKCMCSIKIRMIQGGKHFK